MSVPIRVLVVGDSDEDTINIISELQRGGYDPTYERVETPEDMSLALEQRHWDAVIADYVMSGFSGLAAVRVMQEKDLELPLIIVSQEECGDIAAEAIKAGAHDCIRKSDLSRLVPALKREMHQADARVLRKKAQEELCENEERFRILAETATDAILLADEDSVILYVNKAAENIFGYSIYEMLGQNLTMLMPEYIRQHHLDTMKQYLRSAHKQTLRRRVELPGLHKSGRIVPLEISYSDVIRDHKHLFAAIVRDVSDRVAAEEAIRRSEENFRAIFNYTPAAVFAYDQDGVILQANPACERVYGFTREQLVGRKIWETFGKPEDRERTQEMIRCVYRGEVIENVEWEDRRQDGTTVFVLASITPVYNARGEVIMGLSLNMDITERKMAERREREIIEAKREFYRRTILAATEGRLVISDYDEIRSTAGPALEEWEIRDGKDISAIREGLRGIAESYGMNPESVEEFVLCSGEAATNAYKHAGGGVASVHEVDDSLMFVASDQGKGIEALALPELALKRGYTTAISLGMGYKVMISLADKVYLATGPAGTMVAVEKRLHEEEGLVSPSELPDMWTTAL